MYICIQFYKIKDFVKNVLLYNFASKIKINGKNRVIPEIRISDYDYGLPDERIAKFPLERRDASKLLVYGNDGEIKEDVFHNLPDYLEGNEMMVFNDTKVVPARLFFRKSTGAHIEIFCLEPYFPKDYNLSFASTGECEWNCIVGNMKKWKNDEVLQLAVPDDAGELNAIGLTAALVSRDGAGAVVRFNWSGGLPFSSVLEHCGKIPIPPYLNRESEESDYVRYQTLYARHRGSVAAPTAGLHFTDEVLADIKAKGVDMERICLHVGAGTFLPVKSDSISGHKMHNEPFRVSRDTLCRLLEKKGRVISVGTTSIRTLESLYYLGVKVLEGKDPDYVEQWAPYTREYGYTAEEALKALIGHIEKLGTDSITASTGIIIVPGFNFRMTDRLITNFHQPRSTLLLLISAFVGGDWRRIYDYALGNGFRFLSYGDSSLLYRR
jgi:S-adenosylmethionine:tRNA ribosyltransferase-isomerase